MDNATVIDNPVVVNVEPATPPLPEPPPEPAPVVVVPIDPEPSELELRMRAIEERHNLHDAQLVELRQMIETRAEVAHEHPVPANLVALSDHLDAMETDDVPPQRKQSVLRRKLW